MASGIQESYDFSPMSTRIQRIMGLDIVTPNIAAETKGEPGNAFLHVNPNSQILGIIIERATGQKFSEYFSDETHKMHITRPFEIINQATNYDVRCSVKGGGPTGQAGAMVHGIAKALVLFDENLKATLKTEKLTTRDSRAVERKKPGRRKARRSFQFSKR